MSKVVAHLSMQPRVPTYVCAWANWRSLSEFDGQRFHPLGLSPILFCFAHTFRLHDVLTSRPPLNWNEVHFTRAQNSKHFAVLWWKTSDGWNTALPLRSGKAAVRFHFDWTLSIIWVLWSFFPVEVKERKCVLNWTVLEKTTFADLNSKNAPPKWDRLVRSRWTNGWMYGWVKEKGENVILDVSAVSDGHYAFTAVRSRSFCSEYSHVFGTLQTSFGGAVFQFPTLLQERKRHRERGWDLNLEDWPDQASTTVEEGEF